MVRCKMNNREMESQGTELSLLLINGHCSAEIRYTGI